MPNSFDKKIDEGLTWRLLLTLAKLDDNAEVAALDAQARPTVASDGEAILLRDRASWYPAKEYTFTDDAIRLFDLYSPICSVGHKQSESYVVAHLGQSLDGRIAAENGASRYVTGPDNITHLHRLRALCDAVIVGASTVQHDNPRLTTRRVSGDSPVRVVLDPRARLHEDYGVFQDGASTTLVVRAARDRQPAKVGLAEVMSVAVDNNTRQLCLNTLIKQLRQRGLHRLFVEGGGVTVSHFLQQGLLDRLHLAIAPLIIGSGRPGLSLPPISDLSDAIRQPCRRFEMGQDVLFDLQFKSEI
jgi:riboflavin-specific deaminase-like protein